VTTYSDPTFSATYQGICNKIADTLNRQDLTSVIPDFVTLATTKISRDLARVRHPLAITRAIATVQNNYVPLPTDYISVYQLMDQDTSIALAYLSPDQSMTVQSVGWNPSQSPVPILPAYYAPTGTNIYYTIIGNTIRIIPPPTTSAPTLLDLWYFARLSDLSSTNQTNWALTNFPDLYLYGALIHTAPYLKNDERVAVWNSMYQSILDDIEVQADRAIRPQTKLVAARRSF
jgi:hypothetical protein